MTDLRDRIASAIARVTAAKAPDEVLTEIAKTHTLEPIPVEKVCPVCEGARFLPVYEADSGYRGGYHQVGESRCGRCGGDGVIMEPDD